MNMHFILAQALLLVALCAAAPGTLRESSSTRRQLQNIQPPPCSFKTTVEVRRNGDDIIEPFSEGEEPPHDYYVLSFTLYLYDRALPYPAAPVMARTKRLEIPVEQAKETFVIQADNLVEQEGKRCRDMTSPGMLTVFDVGASSPNIAYSAGKTYDIEPNNEVVWRFQEL